MKSWHRPFAYLTASLVIGLLVIVFTNSFLEYVNYPGWVGYLSLIGYGLVFVNIAFVLNRRFTKKRKHPSPLSYLMGGLMIAPTLLWVLTKEEGALGENRMVFVLTVTFAAFLGTWYGIKAGRRKRAGYLRDLEEERKGKERPDELRRPHDGLTKN